jgi:two-component system nitrate/nitrite response regulator NarL
LLESAGEIEVVGEAGNAADAERLIMGRQPDVAVLDISMVGESGLQLAEKLRARGFANAIVMVTMHTEVAIFKRAVAIAKIDGYVLKLDAADDLVNAIKGACNGQRFVSPAIAQEMAWLDPQSPEDPLSEREREVLVLVAEGLGSDAIAARLSISKRTVDNHRANIRKKLNLNNAAELTRYALENGLLGGAGSGFKR